MSVWEPRILGQTWWKTGERRRGEGGTEVERERGGREKDKDRGEREGAGKRGRKTERERGRVGGGGSEGERVGKEEQERAIPAESSNTKVAATAQRSQRREAGRQR